MSADDDRLLRRPPHNLEAEQALLGAILLNNDAHDRVSSFLERQHFYDPLHQQVYETAAKLITAGRRADPITLKPFFEGAEPIDATLTVPQYLGRLAANATTVINARDYGRTVYDLATRRQLILIGEDMVHAAYDSSVDFSPKEQIEEAETRLYALAERGDRGGAEIGAAAMHHATIESIEEAHKNPGKLLGLPTGIKDLDRRLCGLRPGHLIVVAGRPAMGKTGLATSIVHSLQRHSVVFFSLEMAPQELSLRMLAAETGIASDRLARGDLKEHEWRPLLAAKEKLSLQRLTIDPIGSITIAQLTARARRFKRQRNTELIVIDYLQLMQGTKRNNRVEDMSEITVGLKALAKELDVPVVALSQLSRNVEHRSDKRPQLADLRESGSIEQDADTVLFVFREEYYLEQRRPEDGSREFAEWTADMARVAGVAELIIGKNRHAPVGTIKVQWEGPTMRFSDVALQGSDPSTAKGVVDD